MTTRLVVPAAALLLAAPVVSQCFEQNFGVLAPIAGGSPGTGDDVLFDLQPMNITFPMGGLAASYTHAHVCSNGVIFLTNGAPSGGSTYAYHPISMLVGAAGTPPRIAPLWVDLESNPALFGGGVYINNTIPGKFVVTWANVVEWATQGPPFTFQAQLFANGDVSFFYNSEVYGVATGFGAQFDARAGISEGNGVADPGPVDLSAGNINLTSRVMYETWPLNVFDLQQKVVTFINAGTGYVQTAGPCQPAFHSNYGTGCYEISNSFYQYFPDATTAPSLNGQSMVFTPTGSEYLVTWGGASFAAPVAPVTLALADDGEVSQPTSIPFPTPAGPVSNLWIAANGIVSMASNPDAWNYIPDANTFLNCSVTAWWSWHDYNPTESGSGPVQYHEAVVGADTIAYVTWNGVESYPTGTANPSTLQFQFNLTTGAVAIVWVSIDGNPSSPYGSAHLVGWSPAGVSSNGGSINLATALPLVTQSTNIFPLKLSASPAPVSSATVGTNVIWTTENMRQLGGGLYVGLHVLSLGQIPGGLDLGFLLGAPGCRAYVTTLDFTQAIVGATPTNTSSLYLPPGLPTGIDIYGQSVCLIPPNSMPNGQNAGGYLTSNGVRTFISSF
jgi:hypothetical protein